MKHEHEVKENLTKVKFLVETWEVLACSAI